MIQLIKKYQEYVILGIVIFISLIVGWMSAQTTFIEEQVQVKKEVWSAPVWCGKNAENFLTVLREKNPWQSRVVRGSPKPQAPEPEPQPTWKVLGVDRTDTTWEVILSIDEDRGEGPYVKRLKAGETFLENKKIQTIEKDKVRIDDDGNEEEVELF